MINKRWLHEIFEDKQRGGFMTTKQGYAAGIWRIEDGKVNKSLWITSDDGDICNLYERVNGSPERFNNAEANASLIASAPELLNALRSVVDILNDVVNGDGVVGGENEVIKQALDVLDKAEGRA